MSRRSKVHQWRGTGLDSSGALRVLGLGQHGRPTLEHAHNARNGVRGKQQTSGCTFLQCHTQYGGGRDNHWITRLVINALGKRIICKISFEVNYTVFCGSIEKNISARAHTYNPHPNPAQFKKKLFTTAKFIKILKRSAFLVRALTLVIWQ